MELLDNAATIASAEEDEREFNDGDLHRLNRIARAMELTQDLLRVQLALLNRAAMSWDVLAGEFSRIGPPLARKNARMTRQGLHARYADLIMDIDWGLFDAPGLEFSSPEDLIESVDEVFGEGWDKNEAVSIAAWERRQQTGPGWWWEGRRRPSDN